MARVIDYVVQNVIGSNVKKYWLEQSMSQKDLSNRLETYVVYICRGSVSRIENHERTETDFELKVFSDVFNVPIYMIFMKRMRIFRKEGIHEGKSKRKNWK